MQSAKPITVLFYGPTGSGKGTQAKLLKEFLEKRGDNVMYVETGERLREFVKGGGIVRNTAKQVMEQGGLLPAFLPVHVWSLAFIEEFSGSEHIILDGLARRDDEAPVLNDALRFLGRGDYELIILDLTEESARARLSLRGRSDDEGDDIKKKFVWYKQNVEPAIAHFAKFGQRVHHINAEPSVEEVQASVLKTLGLS